MVAKKKTQTQIYIDKAVKQAVEASNTGVNVSHCNITVEPNTESVIALCDAVKANAKAIRAAAESLKQQNVYGMYFDGVK